MLSLHTGRAKYQGEYERIMGQHAKRTTARLAMRAGSRSRSLALAYSTTMAASYMLLMAHAASTMTP